MDANGLTPESGIPNPAIATDLGLIEGEHVLWTGCPIINMHVSWPVVRKKLRTIAWLVVPTVLAWTVWHQGDNVPDIAKVIVWLIAGSWFVLTINLVAIHPLTDRFALRRTRYVLTTRRAFVTGPLMGGTSIRFVFIDALPAQFSRFMQSDGTGDITVGPAINFRQIPNSEEVHRKLVAAVLAARRDLPDLGWQNLSPTLP